MSTTTEAAVRSISYVSAVREALRQCMTEDDRVFIAGEDVGAYGGVFGTTRGLLADFGERRVVDTPISEAAIAGLAVGAAATGLRPVVEIMFMDFIGCCMDQVCNQMAKMRYMFGGKATLPITLRTMAGAGGSMAAQHSQSLEAWLCHLPGLKVVMPSNAYDAKGLLISAIHDDNPVVVVDNKQSLGATAEVPEGMFEVPIGQARVVRAGSDATVVATGRMVAETLKAAGELAGDGVSLEVIDPRSLQPFDIDTVLASIGRTHRCLVVHEAVRFGGIGAEIAAEVQELAFDELDAPVHRVGAPFSPVPFSPVLERRHVPSAGTITSEVRRLLAIDG
jgi:pyruvate dehydrogenase E1 component beta subunit